MLYAVTWFVVAALLALWSLLAWAVHGLAVWVILAAGAFPGALPGAIPGAAPAVEAVRLPEWLAPWVPPELVSAMTAWLSDLGPLIERLFQAAPALASGMTFLSWAVWGLGTVLLVMLGAGLHLAIALWRRRGTGTGGSSGPALMAG